ncbi:ATP-binding protein [Candidatus Saccharibacteria bacterium]|nr:ATP-binding protein [Candidatus Saccharibacteria bacterium]
MKPESLPLVLAIIAMTVQGLLVVTSRMSLVKKIFFTIGVVCCSLWAAGIFFFLNTTSNSELEIMASIYYAAAAGIAWESIPVAYALAGKTSKRVVTAAVVSFIPFALLTAFVVLRPNGLITSTIVGDYNSVNLNYVYYFIFTLYFVIYCAISSATLFMGFKKAVNKLEKSRTLYILASYIIPLVFGGIFNLLLPWLGNYTLIWVGPLGIIIFVLITYTAITKYRLFNVKLYIARFLALGTVFLLLTISYLLIISVLYSSDKVELIKILVNVFVTLIFSTTAYFAFRVAIYITGRRFRGGLLADNLVYQISLSVLRNTDVHKLLHAATDAVASHMRVSRVSLSVLNKDSDYFYSTDNQPTMLKSIIDHIALYMDEQKIDIVVTEELEIDSDLYDLLSSQNIAVIVRPTAIPTISSVITYVTVRRFPLRIYSDKEVDVLKTIVHVIRIAVDNATYYKQINEFNQELETRITAATADLRSTNRKLKKLDATKDDFLSIASHQLRTPLTSIKGYISMLLDSDFGHLATEQKKILGEVYTSSERMAFIIDDFLDVSRLQSGKLELQKTPTKLNQILESEITQLKITANMRKIAINYNAPDNLSEISSDANKLRQVMMNMIDNAIYYSRGGGKVTVSLYEQRGQIIFTVKDQGIGVPRAEQHKLFTKFYRASNARKARPDGSGVGLYVARKVIIAHGGSLIFESKENVGSTFGFRLPIKLNEA